MSKRSEKLAARQNKLHGKANPRRITFLQVFGELFFTFGFLLLLYVAWELWWTNVEADKIQNTVVKEFVQEFNGPVEPIDDERNYGEPEVYDGQANNMERLGVMYIPRFGENYIRPLMEGVGPDVLDTYGVGHYPGNAMPGAVGNFAVAGHRQTHGSVFDDVHTLQPGDKIYVQTRAGYYIYSYRNQEVVLPTQTDVLDPVPTQPAQPPRERILTLTSCNPRFGSQERIISYAVLESWKPLGAGPPRAIAAQVAALKS